MTGFSEGTVSKNSKQKRKKYSHTLSVFLAGWWVSFSRKTAHHNRFTHYLFMDPLTLLWCSFHLDQKTSIQVCCAQNKPVACRPAGLFFFIEAADLLSLLLEMKIDARITYMLTLLAYCINYNILINNLFVRSQ
jgi:hypothetical protein